MFNRVYVRASFFLLLETHYLNGTSKKKCGMSLHLQIPKTYFYVVHTVFSPWDVENCRHHDVGNKVLATCWIELILFGNFLEKNLSLSHVMGWEIEYANAYIV